MGSVNAYMAQFSDLKAKIAKRGRKLVDFDGARNNYATVKASSKKVCSCLLFRYTIIKYADK